MTERASLLLALPSYDGTRVNARAMADVLQVRNLDIRCMEIQSSLLALAFNRAWAAALDAKPDFFLLMHADIIPVNDDWVQILFAELADHKASALSVVSPIKTPDGLTSTALDTDPWNPRRLTMTEVFERPETWTEPGLLLNTGLLLVDFRQPWVRDICFTIRDRIVRREDGSHHAEVAPEDWNFSRDAARAGAKLFATRKVTIQHIGRAGYDNSCAWGEHTVDPLYATEESK